MSRLGVIANTCKAKDLMSKAKTKDFTIMVKGNGTLNDNATML